MKAVLLVAVLFFYFASAYCQPADIVATQGITYPLHSQNIGKIIFTSREIPLQEMKESDFLHSYILTNTSDLYITVFMGNSLTNYLHTLAPSLSLDTLNKRGNYQFTLYVDGRMIYSSDLLPGAPREADRNTLTAFTKPLIDNANPGGYWSQSFWYRFLHNGGDSALTEGHHLLRMEIRPYVNAQKLLTGDLIAAGDLELQVKRKPIIDLAGIELSPVRAYDGFAISKEHFNANKIKELKGNIAAAVFKNISSIVVIKNGKLLIEEYFNGENRTTPHDPRSAGKSFSSTITGIAIRDGYLKNEDQQLQSFYDLTQYANYTNLKTNVSIKDLLTMSSAFDGNDEDGSSPGNEENMYPTDNWVKFVLDLPIDTIKPKGEWHYFTAGVILLGDILNNTLPGGLEHYADSTLFKPLHIINYKWQYTPQHVPNTAGSIEMNALDFAKYGQLYKNDGRWNGQQIVPKEWVHKTFKKQKKIPGRNNEYYSYLFWNKVFHVKDKNYETYYCAGNGGNCIFIFKDQPLVVVVTATAYGAPFAHTQISKMMEEFILPAIIDNYKNQ